MEYDKVYFVNAIKELFARHSTDAPKFSDLPYDVLANKLKADEITAEEFAEIMREKTKPKTSLENEMVALLEQYAIYNKPKFARGAKPLTPAEKLKKFVFDTLDINATTLERHAVVGAFLKINGIAPIAHAKKFKSNEDYLGALIGMAGSEAALKEEFEKMLPKVQAELKAKQAANATKNK
ncbi:hypothetical protein [Fundidesulfovibrio putealis]|uniref:hypothetical protein n=1 Tax=Fundidesulfovibrio putealis TaxID=270496 RepID=UPI000409AE74|nr:hypothetical protein [Fundidesulfovibrio putealis]